MSKTTMTAAFAVILAAATSLALGQTTPTTVAQSATTGHTTGTANHLLTGQIRTTAMNGATVYDAQDKKIGDVKDIVLDREGRVAAVVLDVGAFLGMGGKFVALTMNDIKVSFDTNNKPKFALDMTKDQLKSAQAYDLDEKKTTTGSTAPSAERDQ